MEKKEKILHCGWMVKSPPYHSTTGIFKAWCARYFVLVEIQCVGFGEERISKHNLCYYGDRKEFENGSLPKGIIEINSICKICNSKVKVSEYKHSLIIETHDRCYVLCTKTEEERDKWLEIIHVSRFGTSMGENAAEPRRKTSLTDRLSGKFRKLSITTSIEETVKIRLAAESDQLPNPILGTTAPEVPRDPCLLGSPPSRPDVNMATHPVIRTRSGDSPRPKGHGKSTAIARPASMFETEENVYVSMVGRSYSASTKQHEVNLEQGRLKQKDTPNHSPMLLTLTGSKETIMFVCQPSEAKRMEIDRKLDVFNRDGEQSCVLSSTPCAAIEEATQDVVTSVNTLDYDANTKLECLPLHRHKSEHSNLSLSRSTEALSIPDVADDHQDKFDLPVTAEINEWEKWLEEVLDVNPCSFEKEVNDTRL